MKLQFLGKTYEPARQQITTLPTQQQATYRGRKYTPSRPVTTYKSQLTIRKYRGVTYMLQTSMLSGVEDNES